MKKAIKWTAIAALTPVLLFVLLAALLYMPPVQNWAVDRVAAVVSEQTGMDISVGTVRLHWPLDLKLNGFRAIHEGDTLADVQQLTADVQLRPLLDSRVVVNELSLQGAKLNTNGFISDVRVKGRVGELWLRSDGIDLGMGTAEVNGARLIDADLDIALSDTAAVDTTESAPLPWRIDADSLTIHRSQVALHLPGDTLHVAAYMGHVVARQADIDLLTSTYRVASFDWHDGQLTYDEGAPTAAVKSPSTLDYGHISLSDIRLGIDSIYYGPMGTSLYVRKTAMKERCGLQVTELTGGVRLDTAFTHIELPRLTLRTTDSSVDGEAYVDFSVADSLNPGKMRVRLNAMLGKQDLMRFMGDLPQQFVRNYPHQPLTVKGSLNGNMQRLEFTGVDVSLPTALHAHADGVAYNVTDVSRLRGQIALKAESHNLGFVTALADVDGLRLPPMTLTGELKADGRRYDADLTLREGRGTVSANITTTRLDDLTAYNGTVQMSELNLYHFLPADSLMNLTADIAADATLNNGRLEAVIGGSNDLLDGTISIDALMEKTGPAGRRGSKSLHLEATILPDLNHADLYRLKLSDKPLTVGMEGKVTFSSDFKQSHELKGLLDSLYIRDEKATYHPENIGLLLRTNRDTTLARIQSGDFIVKLDASGGYEPLLSKVTIFTDTLMAQYDNKVIDQQALKRLLPTAKLHVESGRGNPVANILRTMDIDFRELKADITASSDNGLNGQMHLYSLNYDSTRIDTIRLALTHHHERLSYQGQITNNRRNPQFVFNALFDGHLHEHGALIGVRYFDSQGRMGVRLGATASMVSDGLNIQFMPERPTIGYKEFNLNKDNFLHIDRRNRIQAKIDLIADDRTGMKIYSESQDSTMLQDLTVSLNRIDLGEVTSVMPYLPRMSGLLNGDYHIVMDQQERISVVSDMAVSDMAFESSPIGNLSTELVYMQRENGGHAIEAHLMLDDEEFGMLNGTLTPSAQHPSPTTNHPSPTTNIDATFTMTRFPLSLANGFVPDQLVGLDGYGEGQLTISGTTDAPLVNGEVYVDSAHLVSIPYGINMRFDNDPVRIVGSHLLLENFGLYAYNDEPLNMQGDIDFSDLDNMQMDLRVRARNFQIINARQELKSIAYGKAYVNFFARMNGPLDALNIRGRLDVLGATDMTYMLLDSPLSTDNRLEELVKFTDFNDTTQTVTISRPKPTGVNMDLTLSVSQGAHIMCNLNQEQTNYIDLMGGGDLRMRYTGEGLLLTGRYTLSNGEMKYSLPVIPLKTFTIQNGSYVEFTGDPMNPRLNITATERTKASVGQQGEQSRSVNFDCGVTITKTLSDMGLQFIISAPEDNEINSELQAMSVEERGKLAVTMLTTGMYLADGNTSGFSMNSVLSAYLQSEINNITGSALKTLDLSVGIDNATDASGTMHTDYSFKFSKRLFNNRLKIQLGGKVTSASETAPGQQQSFFDNVTMEYRLDQNAQKNVKLFYNQNVYDWLDGYTGLYGAGFVWRKKMDSLWDVFKKAPTVTPNIRPTTPNSTPTPSPREGSQDTLLRNVTDSIKQKE